MRSKRDYLWFVVCLLLLLGLSFFIFWDYLTLNRLYIYTDAAQDIYVNLWPNYIYLARYLREFGFPTWSTSIGLGTSIFAGSLLRVSLVDPFVWPLLLAGPTVLVKLFAQVLVIKIIVAGGLFYHYFRHWLRFSPLTGLVGALAFTFSGQMILRSGWFHYGTEMVFLAVLLIALELFLQRRAWLMIALSFAWLAAYHPVLIYFYGVFSVLYLLFRSALLERTGRDRIVMIGRLALSVGLGMGVGMVVLWPNLNEILNSPRLVGAEKSVDWSHLFGQANEYFAAFFRLYANDLTGFGERYQNWGNYLDAPALYIGLLPLLLLPQLFSFSAPRHRRIFGLSFLIALLYFILPPLRFVLNAFSGYHYKLTSFMVVVFMLYTFGYSFELVLSKGLRSRSWLLTFIYWLSPLLYVLILGLSPQFKSVEIGVASWVVAWLVLYFFAWLIFGRRDKTRLLVAWVGIFILEIAVMSSITVNHRRTLQVTALSDNTSYYDGTAEVVAEIKRADPGLYRLDKGYHSVFCCNDALVQDYDGTNTYQSFNQGSYFEFLSNMGLVDDQFAFRSFRGFDDRYLLRSLVGVKYMLTRETPYYPGFVLVGSQGGINYYENQQALPIGFVYQSHITADELGKLPVNEKDAALLTAFVPDVVTNDTCQTSSDSNRWQRVSFPGATEAYAAEVKSTRSLAVDSFRPDLIEGTISAPEGGLFFLSVPYSRGWRMVIDDQPATVQKVNFGFLGTCLEPGSHRITVRYQPPYFYLAAGVSLASSLLMFALWSRSKRSAR